MTGRDNSLNSAPPPVGPKGPFPLRERWGDRKRNLQVLHTVQGLFENCQAGRASVLASPNIYRHLGKSQLARTLALPGRVFKQAKFQVNCRREPLAGLRFSQRPGCGKQPN